MTRKIAQKLVLGLVGPSDQPIARLLHNHAPANTWLEPVHQSAGVLQNDTALFDLWGGVPGGRQAEGPRLHSDPVQTISTSAP